MKYSMKWDLDSLYEGGSASPALTELLDQCEEELRSLDRALTSLPDKAGDEWSKTTLRLQELEAKLWEAVDFVECLQAQDVSDSVADQRMARIDAMLARRKNLQTRMETLFLETDEAEWRAFLEREEIAPIAFPLTERRDVMRLKMDQAREILAEILSTDGYHAWGRLYEKVAGNLRAEVEEKGEKKRLSMGQLHNKMEEPDRATRRQAFEKLEAAWSEVADVTAMALNSQAGFRLNLYKSRRWESVLDEPLRINRIRRETLDAMWEAVAAESPRLLPYLTEKARILGVKKLMWYDLPAPIAKTPMKYSYDDGAAFILEHFGRFSEDLHSFAAMALEKRWIEAEDRPGKRAGGFCTDFPLHGETRIFMTYGGTYGSVATLGHELGHSYHTWLLKDHPFWATQYPMTLAETASTFGETLLLDAALAAAGTDEQRLSLLGQKAEEATTHLMNLRARFLFETSFFKAREKSSLTVAELNDLMTESQRKAYCDGLDPEGYHPLFWASKLHFYITSMPFYNFPYVFGYLFSNGLYDRSVKEGSGFAAHYMALLQETGSMQCEELARKHLGVDLTRPEFWRDAIGRVLEHVESFTGLSRARR